MRHVEVQARLPLDPTPCDNNFTQTMMIENVDVGLQATVLTYSEEIQTEETDTDDAQDNSYGPLDRSDYRIIKHLATQTDFGNDLDTAISLPENASLVDKFQGHQRTKGSNVKFWPSRQSLLSSRGEDPEQTMLAPSTFVGQTCERDCARSKSQTGDIYARRPFRGSATLANGIRLL